MFSEQQLITMLELQDSMNSKINPDWINAGNDWSLAAMMEAVEAIDHHGWKWWKKQTIDMSQLQMELVDIWHFLLSDILVEAGSDTKTDVATALYELFSEHSLTQNSKVSVAGMHMSLKGISLVKALKLFVATAALSQPAIDLFMYILYQAGMTTNDLYKQYIGKNVLNFFRQDHGYKEGTYIKIWNGQEDNEHLQNVLVNLDPLSPNFKKHLYNKLKDIYSSLTQPEELLL